MNFLDYRENVHSQNGEDGIISEIFKRLKINNGYLCEFGAWDGVSLSNTFNVYKDNTSFTGILIEANEEYHKALIENLRDITNKICLNRFVKPDPDDPNSLSNILSEAGLDDLKDNFSLLSIDVDSCDYEIWKGFNDYRPRVVVIEVNSSYPPEQKVYPCDSSGASAGIMVDLAIEKGYKLVCHTGNLIFVTKELFGLLEVEEKSLEDLFQRNWL